MLLILFNVILGSVTEMVSLNSSDTSILRQKLLSKLNVLIPIGFRIRAFDATGREVPMGTVSTIQEDFYKIYNLLSC